MRPYFTAFLIGCVLAGFFSCKKPQTATEELPQKAAEGSSVAALPESKQEEESKGRKLVKAFFKAYQEACDAPVAESEFHLEKLRRLMNDIEMQSYISEQYFAVGDLNVALREYNDSRSQGGDGMPQDLHKPVFTVVPDSLLEAGDKLGSSESFVSKAGKLRARVVAALKVPVLYNYEISQLETSTAQARKEYWNAKGLERDSGSGFSENYPLDLTGVEEPLGMVLDFAEKVLDSQASACVRLEVEDADVYMLTLYHKTMQKSYSFYIIAKPEMPDAYLPAIMGASSGE